MQIGNTNLSISLAENIRMTDPLQNEDSKNNNISSINNDNSLDDKHYETKNSLKGSQEILDFLIRNSDGYFTEDQPRRLRSSKLLTREYPKDYFPTFSWKIFCKFTFYHLLFFLALGPFTPFILIPFTSLTLMKNLGFWYNSRSMVFQTLIWTMNMAVFILYFIFNASFIHKIDVYMVVSQILLRCMMLGAKYGAFSPEKLLYLRQKAISQEEINNEFILAGWRSQNLSKIYEELEFSLKRHEIDLSLFEFQFMVKPEEATIDRLNFYSDIFIERSNTLKNNIIIYDNKDNNNTDEKNVSTLNVCNTYSATALFMDITTKFKMMKLDHKATIISIILAISRAILPIIIGDEFVFTPVRIVYTIIIISLNIYFFTMNMLFLFTAYVDLMRKKYFLCQLSFLITAKRVDEIHDSKFYPTINFFETVTLRTWSHIREICLDYGKGQFIRLNNFISFVAGLYLIIGGYLVYLIISNVSSGTLSGEQLTYFLQCVIILALEFFCVFGTVFLLIITATEIDNFCLIHMGLLSEVKIFMTDILRKKELYFENLVVPVNFLYRFAIRVLKSKDEASQPAIESKLKGIIGTIDDIIYDLKFANENEPFYVLGLRPTLSIMYSLMIGILSMTYTLTHLVINLVNNSN